MSNEQRQPVPMVVLGMSKAEQVEFRAWLRDCCGMEYDTMDEINLKRAALRWYEEQEQTEPT